MATFSYASSYNYISGIYASSYASSPLKVHTKLRNRLIN